MALRPPEVGDGVLRGPPKFADILASGVIESIGATDAEVSSDDHPDLPRLALQFNRRSLGRLRQMINTINGFAAEEGDPTSE